MKMYQYILVLLKLKTPVVKNYFESKLIVDLISMTYDNLGWLMRTCSGQMW